MVEVCAVFCYCILRLDDYRQYMYVYGGRFIFMSVVVTVWGLWECLLCSGRC